MRQLKVRDFYTTGEMARILGCACQTIIRRIDSGKLKGHRLPGHQGKRRCLKALFRQYLIDQGVPLDRLEGFEQEQLFATAPTGRRVHG
jgi:excisionase family DNA binding protein